MKILRHLTLLLAIFIGGCSKPAAPLGSRVDASARGEWTSDRSYTNSLFKISINVPAGWDLQKGDEENLKFTLKSINLVSGGNKTAEDALRKQFAKVHVPLRALQYPDQQRTEKNPNLLVMIENIEETPTIKTGEDFLNNMEKTMKAAPQSPEFDGPPTKTALNGIDCWTRSSKLKVNGGEGMLFPGGSTVHQRGYAIVQGHYAMTILCTWFSSQDDPTAKLVSENIKAAP